MLMRLLLITLVLLAFSHGAYTSAADDIYPASYSFNECSGAVSSDRNSVNLAWSENESLPERTCNKVENIIVAGPVSIDSGLRYLSYSTLQQIVYSRRKASLDAHFEIHNSASVNKSPIVNFLRI